MDKLIEALGLDIKILISQLINFTILMFILYKFAYKPMLKMLDDRNKTIEKGIANAEHAKDKLIEIQQQEKNVMKKAKKEALEIVEAAKKSGDEKRDEIIKRAKLEIGEIINQEKEKMQTEKAETLKEIKRDVAELITISLEKVLAEGMDAKRDGALIKKTVKSLK